MSEPLCGPIVQLFLNGSITLTRNIDNRVVDILELTTVDKWNHVPTADNPEDANAFLDSNWLKRPKLLMTPDWPFQPSEEILKTKLKNSDSKEVNTDPVYQETIANTASVSSSNVLTLEWQTYSMYEKLFLIVAYNLRVFSKFSGNRTKTGAYIDLVELERAEQNLFFCCFWNIYMRNITTRA